MPTTKINPAHIWRNDITGLRAVAVLPVLLFHAFPSLLPGGFFGVDVFFVISGYLISGIIFRGLIDGTFSYRTFYEKRIKRIIPNLLLVLTFVSVMGYFFLLPNEYSNLGKHIYSSAGFIQNFRLLGEVGYFTEDALRKPLLHLWSLAIEEQFYIVFPIICSLIWYFSKSRKLIGVAVLLIGLFSLGACLLIRDKSFTFYFPLTRFWEIGSGIGLAFIETYGYFNFRKVTLGLRNVISILGFFAILVPMVVWTESMAHPGWVTLAPVFGAVSIIAAYPDSFINRTVLSWRPMTFIGLISYSLYLWHWPLLSFLFICIPNASDTLSMTALAMSFVIAAIVYFYVENPLRRSKNVWRFKTTTVLLSALALAVAFGVTVRKADTIHTRLNFSEEAKAIRSEGEWDAFYRANKIKYRGIEISTPNTEVFPSVIFAGDSHLVQYYLRAQRLSVETGKNVGFIGKTGCFILSPIGCKNESDALRALVEDHRVKAVVIGNIWGVRSTWTDFESSVIDFKKAISQRDDLKVYILLDYPWTPSRANDQQGDYDPLMHFNRLSFIGKLNENDFIVPYPSDEAWRRGNNAITKLIGDRAKIIDVAPYVCPNGKCNLLKWYKDDDHLQPLRLEKEATWLDEIFK